MWVTLATRCPGVIPVNLQWEEAKLQEELVGASPSFQQTPDPSEQAGNVITWFLGLLLYSTTFSFINFISEVQFARK